MKNNRGVKIIGALAIATISIMLFLIPFQDGFSTQNFPDEFELEFDFSVVPCEENFQLNETSGTLGNTSGICDESSFTDPDPDEPPFNDSNDTLIDLFLESISGTNTVGIQTTVTKFDLAGNFDDTSGSILGIPLQSFETSEGFVLDNIEVTFFGVTPEPVVTLNLEGTVDFFIDGDLIETKRLWASSTAINENAIPLVVTDIIPPPLNNRPETFDFVFSNEFEDELLGNPADLTSCLQTLVGGCFERDVAGIVYSNFLPLNVFDNLY